MNVIFICILSLFILPQLPWWAVYVMGSAIGLVSKSCIKSLGNGFLCGSIPWTVASLYGYYNGAELLMTRVSGMLGFEGWIYALLVSLTIGGVAGSLGAVTGYSFKKAFKDQLSSE